MKNDSGNPTTDLDIKINKYDVLSGVHPRHEVPDQFTLEKLRRKYKQIKQILRDPLQTFRTWEKVIVLEIEKVFDKDPSGNYPYHCNFPEHKFTDTENILISNIMNSFNNSFDWILIQSAPDRYGIKILRDLEASDDLIHQYNVLFPYYNYPIHIGDISKLWSRNIEKQIDSIRSLFDSIANTSKYYLKTARKKIKKTPYIDHTKLIIFFWLEHQNDVYTDHLITPQAIENLLYQTKSTVKDETDIFVCWLRHNSENLINTKYSKIAGKDNFIPRSTATPDRNKILSILKNCESIRFCEYTASLYNSWKRFGDKVRHIENDLIDRLEKGEDGLMRGQYLEYYFKHVCPIETLKSLDSPPIPWKDVKY